MIEYLSFADTHSPQAPLAIALGFFDGVHLGHRAVISHIFQRENAHLVPAVFTFSLKGGGLEKKREWIYPLAYRKKQLADMGVQVLLCPDFSEFANLSPREFVQILAQRFHVAFITCGADFTFGKNRSGDVDTLAQLCEEFGIRLQVAAPLLQEGKVVSSSAIKEHLRKGEFGAANQLLGSPYCMYATVVRGRQLGRTVERPTINQHFEEGQLIPFYGAYASVVLLDGERKFGSSYIGVRPTVDGKEPFCETFILDYQGDLYGKVVPVYFFQFMRPEMKFPSLDAMKEDILNIALYAQAQDFQV